MLRDCISALAGLFILAVGPEATRAELTAAWVDEGFETYADHPSLLNVWPFEEKHQDARLSRDQCAGRGTYSLQELPNENSRHRRVFDAANCVNGTDEYPLRLSYGVYIEKYPDKTYRTCEIMNSLTGERIGVGPAINSTYFQVFDGTAWRDLSFAPERAKGWNVFEVTITTDKLAIKVTNAKGQSYEEVSRGTQASFGVLVLGSGKANDNSPTFVDNVLLAGGTIGHSRWSSDRYKLGTRELALIFRVNSALHAYYEGTSATQTVGALESILDEAEAARNSDQQSQLILPWIYEAIAAVKQAQGAPTEELRAVHHEALIRSPDGIGVDGAVRNLAQLLNEPDRSNLLSAIARKFQDTLAGRTAAHLLLDSSTAELTPAALERLRRLVEKSGTETVSLVAVGLLTAAQLKEESGARHFWYVADVLDQSFCGRELRDCYSERAIKADEIHRLNAAAGRAAASGKPETLRSMRDSLFRARLGRGDTWGALAALSDRGWGDERGELIRELNEAKDTAAIRAILEKLVAQAVSVGFSSRPGPREWPKPQTPEDDLWQIMARDAEECGLERVAAIVYQHLSRAEQEPGVDGVRLNSEFAVIDSTPQELLAFWKARFLLARERPWQAEPLLSSLINSESNSLRGQVAYDLARVRRMQHRPEAATQPAAVCQSLVPASRALADLNAQIRQDIARNEERARLHSELEKTWAQTRGTQDSGKAAAALMSIADLELRLGAPERAAEALEVLIAKYTDASLLPAGLDRLAHIYEENLKRADKAKVVRDRLAREFPSFSGS